MVNFNAILRNCHLLLLLISFFMCWVCSPQFYHNAPLPPYTPFVSFFSFSLLYVVHWPHEGGEREYLKCAPWEIWQNKAAAAILANAVLHTKTMLTMLTISTTLTIGAKLLTIGAKLLTTLAYGELHNHITSMLPICAIIIRKRVGHHELLIYCFR